MEAKARVLQGQDCGSLLIDRTRAPYLVGCVLSTDVMRTTRPIPSRIESKVQLYKGHLALELHVQFDASEQKHHLQFLLPYSQHRDFLLQLTEAPALYLLTGSDHPVPRKLPGRQTLHQRVHQAGLAIQLTEAVRTQILLLDRLHPVTPSVDHHAAAFGC
ncbi:hypothetical protein [Tumebacillus lipolyticus]|uniref:Uncharacterized protein n=1 Tax=Tumebacillus lipolyticus TaxID=1280370 RepID=A0ABW4ZVV8_9BACL